MLSDSNRPLVLIVDDEEEILKLIYRQLVECSCEIIPTASPAEAIHILQNREVAVLLCDLHLPGVGGHAVLAAARAANPDIVSIVISGGEDYDAMIRAVNEGGIWKYITKPWRQAELFTMVQNAVARYQRMRRPQARLRNLADEAEQQALRRGTGMEAAAREFVHVVKKPRRAWFPEPADDEERIEEGALLSNRYELGGIIGEGGIGTVYRAYDTLLGMPVAVKVLNDQLSGNATAIATLTEEARIAMRLSHKHIVRLHNLQKAGSRYYLVMEYVKGRTLLDILELHGRLDLDTVLQIVYVCSDAISYAHRQGVLHRDLKPDNLLLTEDGVLKIIDFGIACLVKAQTENDAVMGTPVYMSPEQVRGEWLDSRTDVYSMGVITLELLTGSLPFPENVGVRDVLRYLPIRVTASDVPPPIVPVIEKAVATDREERWPSLYAFSSALIDAAQQVH